MPKTVKRIGFLATGSELASGEVINSNTPKMAAIMQDFGMRLGEHLICDDSETDLKNALEFLILHHDAVITTGGLGPTSDDITRSVVSKLAQKPLVFDEHSWEKIVTRLQKHTHSIPENNRQQAFFPEGATILPNPNGTANACMLSVNNKLIFMLPGPPHECLPIFTKEVLPSLQKNGFESPLRLFRWRLLGVSESAIAEKIDPIGREFNVQFAYRASYPFIDVKLMLDPHSKNHSKILIQVETVVKPYFASHLNLPLTQQLQEFLQSNPKTFAIHDTATKGYFLQKIALPQTEDLFLNHDPQKADFTLKIEGLRHFWEEAAEGTPDSFSLEITHHHGERYFFEATTLIRRRSQNTLDFIAEFSALKILNLI